MLGKRILHALFNSIQRITFPAADIADEFVTIFLAIYNVLGFSVDNALIELDTPWSILVKIAMKVARNKKRNPFQHLILETVTAT